MKTRKLGPLQVSEIGFGTMSFASMYGASPEEAEATRIAESKAAIPAQIATVIAAMVIQGDRLPQAVLQYSYR